MDDAPVPFDWPENTIWTVWQYRAPRNKVRFAGGFTRRNMVRKTPVDRFGIALEAALRHLELESALSRLLCAAMERIADGTYGRFLRCSVMIAPERLGALPWVQICAECQDAVDQRDEPDTSSASARTRDESNSATFSHVREPTGERAFNAHSIRKDLVPSGLLTRRS
jgi:RNA polymerase-binding transcription factor DksA